MNKAKLSMLRVQLVRSEWMNAVRQEFSYRRHQAWLLNRRDAYTKHQDVEGIAAVDWLLEFYYPGDSQAKVA